MHPLHFSLFIHFIGIGMLFTTMFAGWIITPKYRAAPDYKAKLQILKIMKPLGLLSPAAIVVMIGSGAFNMLFANPTYGFFSDTWLTAKLALFVVAAGIGIFAGIQSAKRGHLVGQLAASSTESGKEILVGKIDIRLRAMLIIQTVLILMILVLSIVKPG